ncbi:MAG: Cof-type HAD-IIB family hydrolase [Pseudomonas sp.]|uniref:Cof-type HAD-IIB family hydrolase n=1 Tax=Pseudomonas abieticivorans TaxID=2931382 RepID=UPI0020BE9E11|nr:Cof-type HAD-IIB family hydrolase [Pseudomonas sp. PIA16]MDE1165413.1 Cof-type HAD-IIB family hydrolase [Pseudomonas sp.]
MSEPIKLVLSDMDGTLLMPDHSIGPRVRDALAQLRAAGVQFSLASARPPRAMRAQVLELGVDLPTAAFNGGTLVNPDGSYLVTHPIPVDAVRASLQLFARHPVAVWVFADDLWLLKDTHGDYTSVEQHALGYGPTLVDDFTPYLDRVDKIVASSKDFDLLIELERTLAPLIKGHALGVRSQDYYLDVTALLANKGDALAALAEHVGVPLAQTAVIGDGANDVAMFKRAGFSIAMGQASASVREQACAVTDSNSQQGVARAIVEMILPRAARD